jgi:hypothetical protein
MPNENVVLNHHSNVIGEELSMQLDGTTRTRTTIYGRLLHPSTVIKPREVRRMFIEANRSGRLTIPRDEAISAMTAYLNALIDMGSPESIIEDRHADAEASARVTVGELLELRGLEGPPDCATEHARLIDEALKALAACRAYWKSAPNLRRPAWHTFAVLICHKARDAWASAGRMPRNRNVDSPLAAFTTAALNAVRLARGEDELSPDRISAILRGQA